MTLSERNALLVGDFVKLDMRDHPLNSYFYDPIPRYCRVDGELISAPPFEPKQEMILPIILYNESSETTAFRVFRYDEPIYFYVGLNKITKIS